MQNIIWFVYLLDCSDGTLYCGMTNDLSKRIEKHNSGKGAKYTRGRLPVKLINYIICKSKSDALKKEHQLKKLKKKEKDFMRNSANELKVVFDPKFSATSGVYSQFSWDNEAFMRGLSEAIILSDNEVILGLIISTEGIKVNIGKKQ